MPVDRRVAHPRESRPPAANQLVSLHEAFPVWCKVAALSFGGPAGQIAVMHRLLVEEKRWVSENRFLHALNYCMLLPGPEAQQLATYVGWLLHRSIGGLIAGTLFVLPGFRISWFEEICDYLALDAGKLRVALGAYLESAA